MIELFCRKDFELREMTGITPIHIDDTVSSLSVILLDDIDTFINNLSQDPFDSNSLKNYGLKNEEVTAVLKRVF